MFKKQTVLVLGAGASIDYGLISGAELVNRIWRGVATDINFRGQVARLLNTSIEDDHLNSFVDELRGSHLGSIDAFLENRPEYLEIGKLCIAMVLIPLEQMKSLIWNQHQISDQNWYRYLFNRIGSNLDAFTRPNFSVVTFNYDRSFEYFYVTSLVNSFGISLDQAITLLTATNIVHVYGELAKPRFLDREQGRDYQPDYSDEIVLRAANSIGLIGDANADKRNSILEAKAYIKNSEEIIFLGFGYHKVNLERILPNREDLPGKSVLGTTLGMEGGEIAPVEEFLESMNLRVELGKVGYTCYEYLRTLNIFEY